MSEVTRRFCRLFCLWLFFLASVLPCGAQVPLALQLDPRQLIASLVCAFQTGNRATLRDWLEPGIQNALIGASGEDRRGSELKSLGDIVAIEVNSDPSTISKLSFLVTVTHKRGVASWHISLNSITQRIQLAHFDIVMNFPDSNGLHPRSLSSNTKPICDTLPDNHSEHSAVSTLYREQQLTRSLSLTNQSISDPRVVDFLFATTRRQNDNGANVNFTGERSPTLTFGIASIRVPEDHKFGRIELPFKWSVFGITIHDSIAYTSEHFIIRNIETLTSNQLSDIIKAKAPNRALIFVHGFDNTFDDALFRNAQIIWDLQYTGLSVLFSWASAGDLTAYIYDRESAYLARSAFVALLRMLKETYSIERVDVIAHSMGNLVVLDALENYAQTTNPVQIGELIMAAPDIDRDQFVAMVPEVHKIAKGMTLYASSADRALAMSRVPARVPRAGDVPAEGPISLPSMDTIDVTAVGDEIFGLNHSKFASNRVLMDDIKLILSTSLRPPSTRLSQLRQFPQEPATPKYWRYAP